MPRRPSQPLRVRIEGWLVTVQAVGVAESPGAPPVVLVRRGTLAAFMRNRHGQVGLAGLFAFVVFAAVGQIMFGNHIATGETAESILRAPSARHWLGTDELGRDVLEELASGALVSLAVGVGATAISVVAGTLVGLVSGYVGGFFEAILMRLTDIMLTIPALPLIIVLAAVWGQGLDKVVVVIGLTGWATTARLIRSEVLSLRERGFVLRARSIGMRPSRIMRVHLLPHVFPLVVANTVLVVAIAILNEATLSFLGLGDLTRPSWGLMLHNAFTAGAASRGALWYLAAPGLCILLLVLSFTLIGHALNDVLNPRRARRRLR
jgi:peptide/nickel transport system permease protein